MAPNVRLLGGFEDNAYNYKQQAIVFSEQKGGYFEGSKESRVGRVTREFEEAEESEEEEEVLRINVRVRQPYELYRYTKNAMLIISSQQDAVLWSRLVRDLKKTFQAFRFEVDVCLVANPEELYAKCEQFFRSDFTDYGAIALFIVTTMAVNQPQNQNDGMFFEESVVVENFRLDRNATLVGKPKIYITEANRRSLSRAYHDLAQLDSQKHGEVIGFHLPFALPDDFKDNHFIGHYDRKPRPLRVLCDKIAAMGASRKFEEILEETIEDAGERYPLLKYMSPFELVNSLDKALYLERNEED